MSCLVLPSAARRYSLANACDEDYSCFLRYSGVEVSLCSLNCLGQHSVRLSLISSKSSAAAIIHPEGGGTAVEVILFVLLVCYVYANVEDDGITIDVANKTDITT